MMVIKHLRLMLSLLLATIGISSFAVIFQPSKQSTPGLFKHVNFALNGSYSIGNIGSGLGGSGLAGLQFGSSGYYAGLSYLASGSYSASAIYRFVTPSQFFDGRFMTSFDVATINSHSFNQVSLGTELHLSSWFVGGNGYLPMTSDTVNGAVQYTGDKAVADANGRLLVDGKQNYLESYMKGDAYVGTYVFGLQMTAGPMFTKSDVGYQLGLSYPMSYGWGDMALETRYASDSYVGQQYSLGIKLGLFSSNVSKKDNFMLYGPVQHMTGMQIANRYHTGLYVAKDENDKDLYQDDFHFNVGDDGNYEAGARDGILDKIGKDSDDSKVTYFLFKGNFDAREKDLVIGKNNHLCGNEGNCNIKLSGGHIISLFQRSKSYPNKRVIKTNFVQFRGGSTGAHDIFFDIPFNSDRNSNLYTVVNVPEENAVRNTIYLDNVRVGNGYVKFQAAKGETLSVTMNHVTLNPIYAYGDSPNRNSYVYDGVKIVPKAALTLIAAANDSRINFKEEDPSNYQWDTNLYYPHSPTNFSFHLATFVGNIRGEKFTINNDSVISGKTYVPDFTVEFVDDEAYHCAVCFVGGNETNRSVRINHINIKKLDYEYFHGDSVYRHNKFSTLNAVFMENVISRSMDVNVTGQVARVYLDNVHVVTANIHSALLTISKSQLRDVTWVSMNGPYTGLRAYYYGDFTKVDVLKITNSTINNFNGTLYNHPEDAAHRNIYNYKNEPDGVDIENSTITNMTLNGGVKLVESNDAITSFTWNMNRGAFGYGWLDANDVESANMTINGDLGWLHLKNVTFGDFTVNGNVGYHTKDNGYVNTSITHGLDAWKYGENEYLFDVRDSQIDNLTINGNVRADDPYFNHVKAGTIDFNGWIIGKISILNSDMDDFVVRNGLPYMAEIYIDQSKLNSFVIHGDISSSVEPVHGHQVLRSQQGRLITIKGDKTDIGDFVIDGNVIRDIKFNNTDTGRELFRQASVLIDHVKNIGNLSFKKNTDLSISHYWHGTMNYTGGILIKDSHIGTINIGDMGGDAIHFDALYGINLENSEVNTINVNANINMLFETNMDPDFNHDDTNDNVNDRSVIQMKHSKIGNIFIGKANGFIAIGKMNHVLKATDSEINNVTFSGFTSYTYDSAIKLKNVVLGHPIVINDDQAGWGYIFNYTPLYGGEIKYAIDFDNVKLSDDNTIDAFDVYIHSRKSDAVDLTNFSDIINPSYVNKVQISK